MPHQTTHSTGLATGRSLIFDVGRAPVKSGVTRFRRGVFGGALMRRTKVALSLTLSVVLALSFSRAAYAQGSNPAREILAGQPDFAAEETINDFEPHLGAGFSATSSVAKRGGTYRADNGTFIFLFKPDGPYLRLYVKGRTYEELPLTENQRAVWHTYANHVGIFAGKEKVLFEIARDGDEYVVIKATPEAEPERAGEVIYFYAAKRLRNLVTKIELLTPGRRTVWDLSNISFDVPAKLFEIPPDYKRERD